jgi:hypothetical protein
MRYNSQYNDIIKCNVKPQNMIDKTGCLFKTICHHDEYALLHDLDIFYRNLNIHDPKIAMTPLFSLQQCRAAIFRIS